MKYIWEESDIQAGVCARKASNEEVWIIGYLPTIRDGEGKWAFVSMWDGMIDLHAKVGMGRTAKEMCEHFNMADVVPVDNKYLEGLT